VQKYTQLINNPMVKQKNSYRFSVVNCRLYEESDGVMEWWRGGYFKVISSKLLFQIWTNK